MSQCYLGSESKTSMTKLYFEVFIANYFYTFNKKDPVLDKSIGLHAIEAYILCIPKFPQRSFKELTLLHQIQSKAWFYYYKCKIYDKL